MGCQHSSARNYSSAPGKRFWKYIKTPKLGPLIYNLPKALHSSFSSNSARHNTDETNVANLGNHKLVSGSHFYKLGHRARGNAQAGDTPWGDWFNQHGVDYSGDKSKIIGIPEAPPLGSHTATICTHFCHFATSSSSKTCRSLILCRAIASPDINWMSKQLVHFEVTAQRK